MPDPRQLDDLLSRATDLLAKLNGRLDDLSHQEGSVSGSGSGVAGRVALWTSATGLGSDAGLTFVAGQLAITSANTVPIALQVSGADSNVIFDAYNASSIPNRLVFRSARGTSGAPSATLAADQLYGLRGEGYHSAGTPGFGGHGPSIRYLANENWTDVAQGTRLEFLTTVNGATALTLAMTIANDQTVSVTAGLNVGKAATAGPGQVAATNEDGGTNTVPNLLQLGHNTTSTPAVGFGSAILFSLETTTTADTIAAYDQIVWVDPTHASRKARRTLFVYDTAQREAIRMDANGTIAVVTIPGGLSLGTAGAAGAGQYLASGSAVDPGISTEIANSDTNTYRVGVTINHVTSGTAAANFGIAYRTQLEDAGGTVRVTSDDITAWADPAAATYKAKRSFFVSDVTTAREGLRIESDGSAPMIGFLGHAAAVKQATITQTYSTTATTITQTAMTDPAAYGAGANGYSTAAMAQAIHAEVIALKANMVVTQNVLNAVIDSLQAYGLNG